jgi:hypothetical protein
MQTDIIHIPKSLGFSSLIMRHMPLENPIRELGASSGKA